ncbi:hypothetical protein ACPCUF_00825 [Streptomyces griseoincarnatus]
MSRRRIDSGKSDQPEGQQDRGAAKEQGDAVRAKVLELANLLRSSDPEAALTGEDLATFAGRVTDEGLTAIVGQVQDEDLTAIAGQVPDEDLAAIAAEYALDMPTVQSADVLASLPEVAAGDTRRAYSERLLKAVRR